MIVFKSKNKSFQSQKLSFEEKGKFETKLFARFIEIVFDREINFFNHIIFYDQKL
jgi:hypothetical protein